MLIGEYTHTLDPKKRLALPAKFRKELGKKVVLAQGLDNCLFVYPLKQWEKMAEKLAGLPLGQSDTRDFSRFLLAGAEEVELDNLGRILIPDFLKEFAKLDTSVVIAGVHTRLEIWDATLWAGYKEKIRGRADSLAEKLGEIGAF